MSHSTLIGEWVAGWFHEDGTECRDYLAPASDNGKRFWCTTHEKHVTRRGAGRIEVPANTTTLVSGTAFTVHHSVAGGYVTVNGSRIELHGEGVWTVDTFVRRMPAGWDASPYTAVAADLDRAGSEATQDRVERLVQLANRAHNIWFDKPLPWDRQLTNGELNTVGWAVSRYGGLSIRELDAILHAGAPHREDLVTPR